MADVVIEVKIPSDNGIDKEKLEIALEVMLKAIYDNIEAVGFKHVNREGEGINEIIVRTSLNTYTTNQIAEILGRLFKQEFDVSFTSEDQTLNRKQALTDAFHDLFAQFNT